MEHEVPPIVKDIVDGNWLASVQQMQLGLRPISFFCDRSRDHKLLHFGGILYRLPGANHSFRRSEHGPRC
eukprot:3896833-Pyramimonas_sp.AAC.1